MLSTKSGLEMYIRYCAEKSDKSNHSGKKMHMMGQMENIKIYYQRIVHELEEISELQEKIHKIDGPKLKMFHDRKSDDHFASPIPFQKFESPEDLLQRMKEIKEKLKIDIKEAGELIQEVKEGGGLECAEELKNENLENAPALLEGFSEYIREDLYRYSPEFVIFSRSIADAEIGTTIDSFESCDQLLEEIKDNNVNLQEHSRRVKGMEALQHGILYATEYEHFYEGRGQNAFERNGDKIQQDGEYIQSMFENYSKAMKGEAVTEEIASLTDDSYLGMVAGEYPKPSRMASVIERVRRFWNRSPKNLLPSEEQSIHDSRLLCLREIYTGISEATAGDKSIKPKKEKSEFEKAIEVDVDLDMVSQIERDEGSIEKKLELTSKDAGLEMDD